MSHTNPSELIEAELQRLIASPTVFFEEHHDIVVSMKNLSNQIVQCYATTNPKHTMKLLIRMAAILGVYFTKNASRLPITGLPRGNHKSMGHGILVIANNVNRAEEALIREGRTDATSHLHTALVTIHKLIGQYAESPNN